MATLYDGSGNPIEVSGSSSSAFDVTDYAIFTDDSGNNARQAVLTYQGKKLYPKNYSAQRLDFVKDYGGGVMLTLGDSYTAMGSSYFDTFAVRHGLVQDNRGVGSSTIAGTTDGEVGFQPFWNRLDTAIAQYQAEGGYTISENVYTADDVKLITFMGGANDWYTVDAEQGIDRIGNIQSEDKAQLYGALNYIFPTMQTVFPNADIVVILQPFGNGYAMRLKEGIVKEMAEMYGIPVCDCAFEWYSQSNPNDLATYWQADKLHQTADGNQAIMAKLEKVVNNLPFSRC